MTATATRADASSPAGGVPRLFHVAAAAWIAGMLALSDSAPGSYRALLQEDRFIEWWTVAFFAAAAVVRFRRALPRRLWFDVLVALFCLFVAGEEFSWGQRLLGFTPPDTFLAHNTQQELNLHNFADVFGQPKGVLILALLGYGGLLPLAARFAAGRRLLRSVGATSPPSATVPWLLAGAALLSWYPADYTGEWVEALAGATFFVAAVPVARTFWTGAAMGAMAAAVLSLISARPRGATAAELSCAAAEVEALVRDVAGGAATPRLLDRSGSIHKRVRTAVEGGYLDGSRLLRFRELGCGELTPDQLADRRRHGVDPWGMAYWISVEDAGEHARRIVIYSMGPNRRRDGGVRGGDGDDARAELIVETAAADSLRRGRDVDPGILALMDRWRARVPREVLVRRGACPFECCLYRRWTAARPIPVVAEERGAGPTIFTIPTGESFDADSGAVHITGIGLVAVEEPVGDADYWSFQPGDTLVVLDYVGEGFFNVWHEGRVQEVGGFWGAEQPDPKASLLGRWASEWWVHVTTDNGRQGWFHVAPGERWFTGADACA